MTPLRQRYIEDLRLKNFSPKTIKVYVARRVQVCQALWTLTRPVGPGGRPHYLVHLMERGLARSTAVVVRNALRHLYTDILAVRTAWRNCRVPNASRGFPSS